MFDQGRVLPDGWEIRTLESLAAKVTSGGTPTSGDPRYYTETHGLPFAKTEDLTRAKGKHLSDCELQITDAALKASAAKRYPVGSILVSMYGTIGLTKITARELAANQALSALLPPFECDPVFLYHQLEFIRPRWSRYSGQTTQANISGAIVRAATVATPSLAEQSAIARILDTLDTQIEKTQALIAKLEQVKEGLLHDLLTRGVDENGKLRPSAEEAPELYKPSALGLIPREWSICTSAEFCPSVADGTHDSPKPANSGYPLVTSKNLKPDGLDLSDSYLISKKDYEAVVARSWVEAGDILFGMIGTVGNPTIITEALCEIAPKNVGIFRSGGDRLHGKFLLNILKSHVIKKQLDNVMLGSTQKFVGLSTLRELLLVVPPRDEMASITESIDKHHARIGNEQRILQKLQTQKRGLMDDLLTGRVRVTPRLDPQETPATV